MVKMMVMMVCGVREHHIVVVWCVAVGVGVEADDAVPSERSFAVSRAAVVTMRMIEHRWCSRMRLVTRCCPVVRLIGVKHDV